MPAKGASLSASSQPLLLACRRAALYVRPFSPVRGPLFSIALVASLLAQPAQAADAVKPEDRAALAACLKQVADDKTSNPGIDQKPSPADHIANKVRLAPHQDESCIDYVTEVCSFTSEDGQSQLGGADCADRERNVWEERLNRDYQAILSKAKPEMGEAVRKMQRAFIASRDARCQTDRKLGAPNGHEALYEASCLLDATARQALVLDNLARALDAAP